MATYNWTWEQGEDLIMPLRYLVAGVPQDMTTFDVRMDIAPMTNNVAGEPIFSFNSADFTDRDLDTVGDGDNEVTTTAEGDIIIKVSRALTLPDGAIGSLMPAKNVFGYDIFIRDRTANTQRKLLEGTITVRKSITQWR